MPSISDTLHIASRAIESALTTSSAAKVAPTQPQSGLHNHKQSEKKPPEKKAETILKETKDETTQHIDLRI